MMLAGDEIARSQSGNNNAYCQDNEIGWIDWRREAAADPELQPFIETLAAVRRAHPALRRFEYFDGIPDGESGLQDTYWLAPEGREMTIDDWTADWRRTIGFQFGNDTAAEDRLLLIFNGGEEEVPFRLPEDFPGAAWRPIFDSSTATGTPGADGPALTTGHPIRIPPRSVRLLRHAPKRARSGRD
jgi:glycogen operon protein